MYTCNWLQIARRPRLHILFLDVQFFLSLHEMGEGVRSGWNSSCSSDPVGYAEKEDLSIIWRQRVLCASQCCVFRNGKWGEARRLSKGCLAALVTTEDVGKTSLSGLLDRHQEEKRSRGQLTIMARLSVFPTRRWTWTFQEKQQGPVARAVKRAPSEPVTPVSCPGKLQATGMWPRHLTKLGRGGGGVGAFSPASMYRRI